MVDISWVTDQIAVGSAFLDEELSFFKNLGIDAIIDVRSEYSDNQDLIRKFGLRFLHVDIDDTYSPSFEQLKEIFNFTDVVLSEGKKVFIHCQNGYGRSPLVVAAILAKRLGSIPEAVSFLEDKHPRTSLSMHQERFLYIELPDLLNIGKF